MFNLEIGLTTGDKLNIVGASSLDVSNADLFIVKDGANKVLLYVRKTDVVYIKYVY